MSDPTLTLGTNVPGELYISSRPVSSQHSFSAARYLFLQTKDLADDERLKDMVRKVNVEVVGRVFDLVIRDAVVEGMERRKSKEDVKKKEKEVYVNPLDSSSVEG